MFCNDASVIAYLLMICTSTDCFLLLFLKVDWLNKFIETMWPYLDKVSMLMPNIYAPCAQIHVVFFIMFI